jgi:hypothetical protein
MPVHTLCRQFSAHSQNPFLFADRRSLSGLGKWSRGLRLIIATAILCCLSFAATTKQYVLTVDPQALAVAQTAFTTMGGANAVAGYQDSLVSGTATIYSGNSPVSYPITMKSKGLRETRVELQMTKGTNVRIVNQGQGAILRPDGSVKSLYSNNTFHEHVNHIPLLSVLSEFANGNVNLLYKGTAKIQDESEDVIEIDFVPDLTNGALFASMSATQFFVNQTTGLIDKVQRSTFYEGDQNNTFNEETYFSDYRAVGGMLVPFHVTAYVGGQMDTDLQFGAVTFNTGIPDSDFVIPQAR